MQVLGFFPHVKNLIQYQNSIPSLMAAVNCVFCVSSTLVQFHRRFFSKKTSEFPNPPSVISAPGATRSLLNHCENSTAKNGHDMDTNTMQDRQSWSKR